MKGLISKLLVITAFFSVLAAFGLATYKMSRCEQPPAICSQKGATSQAYFSPQDDLRSLLISFIDAERKGILFAIYTFTDKAIAQALIRAHKRGVKVEGIVDRSYGHSRYSKVCVLANARVPVWVYQTAADERQAGLMHNKFCVFKENVDGKPLLWTGSYNFTNRASEKNQENVVILDSLSAIQSFEGYFKGLKKRSLQISGGIQCHPKDEQSESLLTKLGTLW